MTAGMLGSRGMRSHSVPARPAPARPEPAPAPARAQRATPARRPGLWRAGQWMGPLTGVAAGWLIASSLSGAFGIESRAVGLLHQALLGVAVFVFVTMLRRRRAEPAQSTRSPVDVPSVVTEPPPMVPSDASLDGGLRDIRRMDPRFDPARFTGYIETVFRGTHTARMTRDVAALRDRVTPELYGELRARGDRLRSLGHASHVEQMDIRAQVTEAWHEDGRDYVTAYITGAMLDYTVDELTGAVVDGSKTIAENVEAFLTFTRPAGLNPWMLSAIQTS